MDYFWKRCQQGIVLKSENEIETILELWFMLLSVYIAEGDIKWYSACQQLAVAVTS